MISLVTGLLLIAALPQEPEPRLRARLEPATAQAVEVLLDSARAAGVPTEPLVQKALEGQAKMAPSARIVSAVAQLLRDLSTARAVLGPASEVDELQAAVLWVRAGGTTGQLARFREVAGRRALAVPLVVSAELLRRGWPASEAAPELERLLQARVADARFLALKSNIDASLRKGDPLLPAVRAEIARVGQEGRTP